MGAVFEYFKICEQTLKSESDKKGVGSLANKTYLFYQQVKNYDPNRLSPKQLEWLANIEDFQNDKREY